MEDVCPMTGNDLQPQHNDHSYVFTCNCSPAFQCVGCSSQQANLKNLQNEYDERKEIITKSKTPILTTRNKPTLIGDFWLVIRNSEHVRQGINCVRVL